MLRARSDDRKHQREAEKDKRRSENGKRRKVTMSLKELEALYGEPDIRSNDSMSQQTDDATRPIRVEVAPESVEQVALPALGPPGSLDPTKSRNEDARAKEQARAAQEQARAAERAAQKAVEIAEQKRQEAEERAAELEAKAEASQAELDRMRSEAQGAGGTLGSGFLHDEGPELAAIRSEQIAAAAVTQAQLDRAAAEAFQQARDAQREYELRRHRAMSASGRMSDVTQAVGPIFVVPPIASPEPSVEENVAEPVNADPPRDSETTCLEEPPSEPPADPEEPDFSEKDNEPQKRPRIRYLRGSRAPFVLQKEVPPMSPLKSPTANPTPVSEDRPLSPRWHPTRAEAREEVKHIVEQDKSRPRDGKSRTGEKYRAQGVVPDVRKSSVLDLTEADDIFADEKSDPAPVSAATPRTKSRWMRKSKRWWQGQTRKRQLMLLVAPVVVVFVVYSQLSGSAPVLTDSQAQAACRYPGWEPFTVRWGADCQKMSMDPRVAVEYKGAKRNLFAEHPRGLNPQAILYVWMLLGSGGMDAYASDEDFAYGLIPQVQQQLQFAANALGLPKASITEVKDTKTIEVGVPNHTNSWLMAAWAVNAARARLASDEKLRMADEARCKVLGPSVVQLGDGVTLCELMLEVLPPRWTAPPPPNVTPFVKVFINLALEWSTMNPSSPTYNGSVGQPGIESLLRKGHLVTAAERACQASSPHVIACDRTYK